MAALCCRTVTFTLAGGAVLTLLSGCASPLPPPPAAIYLPAPEYPPPIPDMPPTADDPPPGGVVSLPSPAQPRPEPELEPSPEPASVRAESPSPAPPPAATVAPFRYVLPIDPVPMTTPAVTDPCVGYWRPCHFVW